MRYNDPRPCLCIQDTVTGECYRLDHLIKLHLEKKLADKKTSADEKAKINTSLTRLDGMDVVSGPSPDVHICIYLYYVDACSN